MAQPPEPKDFLLRPIPWVRQAWIPGYSRPLVVAQGVALYLATVVVSRLMWMPSSSHLVGEQRTPKSYRWQPLQRRSQGYESPEQMQRQGNVRTAFHFKLVQNSLVAVSSHDTRSLGTLYIGYQGSK